MYGENEILIEQPYLLEKRLRDIESRLDALEGRPMGPREAAGPR